MSSSHEVDGETPQLQTRPQSALERDQGERGEELDRAVCREIGQQGTPGARVVTSPSTTASMAWLRNMQQSRLRNPYCANDLLSSFELHCCCLMPSLESNAHLEDLLF